MKDYIKQIRLELKLLTRSKLFIIGAVFLIGISLFGVAFGNMMNNAFTGGDRYFGNEPIVVRDITVSPELETYWNVYEAKNSIEEMVASNRLTQGSEKYQLIDDIYYFYAKTATSDLGYQGDTFRRVVSESRIKIFIIEQGYTTLDEVKPLVIDEKDGFYNMFGIYDTEVVKEILDMTDEEKATLKIELLEKIEASTKILIENDVQGYYSYQIDEYNKSIAANEKTIRELELTITASNRAVVEKQIKDIESRNEIILSQYIPTLEYKLEHGVGIKDDWRNDALRIRENYLSNKSYGPITEVDFQNDSYLKRQHGTYAKYLKQYNENLAKEEVKYLIANKALELNKPDVFYENGVRESALSYLSFSTTVAIFGIMLASNAIAREFQNGTVRLLLIRPKKRIKIFASKLIAVLILLFALHVASQFAHIIAAGIDVGFEGLAYPKIFAYSTVPFMIYFFGTIIMTFLPILMITSFAFGLAALIRRNAMSITIAMGSLFGSSIVYSIAQWTPSFSWVKYTPIPYLSFYQVYVSTNYYGGDNLIDVNFGIMILLLTSIVFIGFGLWNLKVRDVTN